MRTIATMAGFASNDVQGPYCLSVIIGRIPGPRIAASDDLARLRRPTVPTGDRHDRCRGSAL